MEDNKPPLSTASFGFDVESSKSKNVNSIFLPDVKPCKVDLKSGGGSNRKRELELSEVG